MQALTQLGGFKKVLDLMREGKPEEALALQKGLQDQFMFLFEENATLKAQLSEVADILDLSECMVFDGHMYWLEDDEKREGPYCQVCYDRDAELVRLSEHNRHWECRSCNNLYMKPQAKPARAQNMGPTEKAATKPLKEPIPLFAK